MDLPSFSALRIEARPSDPVASLVFDRPDSLNALAAGLAAVADPESIEASCRYLAGRRQR